MTVTRCTEAVAGQQRHLAAQCRYCRPPAVAVQAAAIEMLAGAFHCGIETMGGMKLDNIQTCKQRVVFFFVYLFKFLFFSCLFLLKVV